MILLTPLFDVGFWPGWETPGVAETGLHLLHDLARTCAASEAAPGERLTRDASLRASAEAPPFGPPLAAGPPPAPEALEWSPPPVASLPVSVEAPPAPGPQLAAAPEAALAPAASECQKALLRSMESWMELCRGANVEVGAIQVYGVDYSDRYGALRVE